MLIIIPVVYGGMSVIQSGIWEVVKYVKEIHFLGIQTNVNSIVRIFVFIPLIAFLIAKIFKYKWGHICDSIAMFPLLISGIAQLACIFPGCCAGYEVGWGIYSIRTRGYHFPTPIIETILTLIIFVYLVYRTNKKKYVSDGTLYPLMMVLYGIMRCICEMLRDNEKIILHQSAMGIHAIFMCLVGLLALYLIKKKKAKEAALALAAGATVAESAEDIEHTESEAPASTIEAAKTPAKQNASKKSKKQRISNKRKTKIKKKKKKKK